MKNQFFISCLVTYFPLVWIWGFWFGSIRALTGVLLSPDFCLQSFPVPVSPSACSLSQDVTCLVLCSFWALRSRSTRDSPVKLRYLPPVLPANLAAVVLLSIFSRLSRFLLPASSTHGLLTSWLFPSSALCFFPEQVCFCHRWSSFWALVRCRSVSLFVIGATGCPDSRFAFVGSCVFSLDVSIAQQVPSRNFPDALIIFYFLLTHWIRVLLLRAHSSCLPFFLSILPLVLLPSSFFAHLVFDCIFCSELFTVRVKD
jgi:hypothetical protein